MGRGKIGGAKEDLLPLIDDRHNNGIPIIHQDDSPAAKKLKSRGCYERLVVVALLYIEMNEFKTGPDFTATSIGDYYLHILTEMTRRVRAQGMGVGIKK
ncbi:disease resistance protein RPM1-like protein [Corchorus olitorius]|uniref:Disease resistance protein RPM1-like protein n=1 Tax=Corchorus olitorius TaxID=93759 RepID=A0A1R3FVA3_9ROSI|nr:disease resistance protein RPM1-like protein [Corchorus olitorius]